MARRMQTTERVIRAEHRDDEEIQWYVGSGHDLLSRSLLGAQLEAIRDQVSGSHGGGNWDPSWLLDFSKSSAIHRSRRTAIVLWGTAGLYAPAVAVLWAYCHPTTVTACDGLYGNVGRLLGVLPLTPTGQTAMRGERLLVARNGHRVFDALRSMNAARCQAKGEERLAWSAMVVQAREMRDRAFDAYEQSRRFVMDFEKRFGLMPNRAELADGVRA